MEIPTLIGFIYLAFTCSNRKYAIAVPQRNSGFMGYTSAISPFFAAL